MGEYINQHFIPKFIVKNFSNKGINNSKNYFINLFNLLKFNLVEKNVNYAFCKDNMYDDKTFEDIKKLEKDFGNLLEQPVSKVLNRIIESDEQVILSTSEYQLIKKHLLLMFFRIESNMTYYYKQNYKDNGMSDFQRCENETDIDFWKREMKTILYNDWNDIQQSDEISLSVGAFHLFVDKSYLAFWRTNNEEKFILPDTGKVSERIYLSSELYVDNFYLYPITPELAIILVSPVVTNSYMRQDLFDKPKIESSTSDMSSANKSNNPNKLENQNKIYTYKIKDLNMGEVVTLNILMLNETMKYFGFNNPKSIIRSVKNYNILQNNGMQNMKKNYQGLVTLLMKS